MVLKFPEEGSLILQPKCNLPRPVKILTLFFLFSMTFQLFLLPALQIKFKNNFIQRKSNNKTAEFLHSSVQINVQDVQFVLYKPQSNISVWLFLLNLEKSVKIFLLHQRFIQNTKNCFFMENSQYKRSSESHSVLNVKFLFFSKLKRKILSESHFHLKRTVNSVFCQLKRCNMFSNLLKHNIYFINELNVPQNTPHNEVLQVKYVI